MCYRQQKVSFYLCLSDLEVLSKNQRWDSTSLTKMFDKITQVHKTCLFILE